jgi:adenine C2-methylase RlmN of 23S rRNA A2503 and tRNA A37
VFVDACVLAALQFCYTGRMGLLGNLTTAQMVEQLVEARRWLAQYTQQQQQQQAGDASLQSSSSSSSSSKKTRSGSSWPLPPPRINNIVFMGECLV